MFQSFSASELGTGKTLNAPANQHTLVFSEKRAVKCKCLAKIWLYIVRLQFANIWAVGLP